MQEAIRWLALPPLFFQNYQRPIPEDISITSTNPYLHLIKIFPEIYCTCIIGYKFAEWEGGRDDNESFELVTDLLRWKPKPILIINPNREELLYLVELLETNIKQKIVYGLCCKWNILSKFILIGLFEKVYRNSCMSKKSITDAYLWFEEFDEIVENEKMIANGLELPIVIQHSLKISNSKSLNHLMKMCECTKDYILKRLIM